MVRVVLYFLWVLDIDYKSGNSTQDSDIQYYGCFEKENKRFRKEKKKLYKNFGCVIVSYKCLKRAFTYTLSN